MLILTFHYMPPCVILGVALLLVFKEDTAYVICISHCNILKPGAVT